MRSRHHYRTAHTVVVTATIGLVVALAGTTSAAVGAEPDSTPIEGASTVAKVMTPLIVSCFTPTPEPTISDSTGALDDPGAPAGGVGAGAAPARIMMVGDSITHGAAGDFTFRYRLWQMLTAQAVSFDAATGLASMAWDYAEDC